MINGCRGNVFSDTLFISESIRNEKCTKKLAPFLSGHKIVFKSQNGF